MSLNVGHAIQKLIHNAPVAISVNDTTTSVATSGGNVYQSGLISNMIQNTFKEIMPNQNIVGHVVDIQSTTNVVYMLNDQGVVFAYDYNTGACSPVVREVYSPSICNGDPAVRIRAGAGHLVILTKKHKVWGVGDNSQYQLVPQGQCKYDVAVELLITDTNVHDNYNCCSFVGTLNELEQPRIPRGESCGKVSCIKKKMRHVDLGTLVISNVRVDELGAGELHVPVQGDLEYVGFLCVGKHGDVDGTITYTLDSVVVPEGCVCAFYKGGDETAKVKITSSKRLCLSAKASTFVTQISADDCDHGEDDDCCGRKGESFRLKLSADGLGAVLATQNMCGLILTSDAQGECCSTTTTLIPLGSTTVDLNEGASVGFELSHRIEIDCCVPCENPEKDVLPQPCWMSVYAGFDTTVLVDSCNRMYVLGSIHNVRNNAALLRRTCLDELLSQADATISMPAGQLNCGVSPNNTNCTCNKNECRKPFRTDLDKFAVSLKFPKHDGEDDCECGKSGNVCDFLRALKQCNEAPHCDNTCAPCDPNIYLDVFECGQDRAVIDSITIINKKSVCKAVSQGCFDYAKVCLRPDTVIEFDLNRYCVDGADYPLSKALVLSTGARDVRKDCQDVTIYVDLDNPGSIMFSSPHKTSNVEFVVGASNKREQFILNYGDVMDPVELANLKSVLVHSSGFPCPQFRNPICPKLFNTYLKGGDSVKFYNKRSGCGVKLAVTADVPTVFRLNRRVLDIGVGANNLSVLVGGLACPNEIFAIGQNCYGELGLESHQSVVCWKQVNRCLFDCQVNAIFTGPTCTMYVTQSGRVFGSGLWKCLINSTVPVCIPSIPHSWKIQQIAISKNQIVMLSQDKCLFGVGDNRLGELGLCHIDCVPVPVPIGFLAELNRLTTKQVLACNMPVAKCCKPLYKDCEPCVVKKACCDECASGRKCRSERAHHANNRLAFHRR